MIDLEEQLRDSLDSAANAVAISPDPLAQFQSRSAGHRRRGPHGLSLTLAVAGVAAAVALVVVGAILVASRGPGSGRPSTNATGTKTTLTLVPRVPLTAAALATSVSIMRDRIDALHVAGVSISTGKDRVVIQVPANKDGTINRSLAQEVSYVAKTQGELRIRQALSLKSASPVPSVRPIRQTPRLAQSPVLSETFMRHFEKWNCSRPPTPSTTSGRDRASNYLIGCEPQEIAKYLLAPAALRGTDVAKASAVKDQSGQWLVQLTFNSAGAQAWHTVTANAYAVNNGQPQTTACAPPTGCNAVAILVDGAVKTAPYISASGGITGGTAQISGGLTGQSAKELSAILAHGPLPTSFLQSTVSDAH